MYMEGKQVEILNAGIEKNSGQKAYGIILNQKGRGGVSDSSLSNCFRLQIFYNGIIENINREILFQTVELSGSTTLQNIS